MRSLLGQLRRLRLELVLLLGGQPVGGGERARHLERHWLDMLRSLARGDLIPMPEAWVWTPMAAAPRDGTVILDEMRADLAQWAGRYVAGEMPPPRRGRSGGYGTSDCCAIWSRPAEACPVAIARRRYPLAARPS